MWDISDQLRVKLCGEIHKTTCESINEYYDVFRFNPFVDPIGPLYSLLNKINPIYSTVQDSVYHSTQHIILQELERFDCSTNRSQRKSVLKELQS